MMSADIENLIDELKGAWLEQLKHIKDMQAKLESQAEELDKLRGFANEILSETDAIKTVEEFNNFSSWGIAEKYGLIEEKSNHWFKSPLLTGKIEVKDE